MGNSKTTVLCIVAALAATGMLCAEDADMELYGEATKIVRSGDADALAGRLRDGLDPDLENNAGETLLMYAVEKERPDMIRVLLAAGADIRARNHEGRNAAGFVSLYEVEARHQPAVLACVELLLDAGHPIDEPVREDGGTLLAKAAGYRADWAVAFLLAHGADPSRPDHAGLSPLWSLARGSAREWPVLPTLRMLVDAGCPADGVDDKGRGLLYYLAKSSDAAAALYALDHFPDPALGKSVVVIGLSLAMREGFYASNPAANWMAPVNSVLACGSGLAVTTAFVLGKGMLGLTSSNKGGGGGMEALGIGVATGAAAIFGLFAGSIAGIVVGLLPGVRTAFADSRLLYYIPSCVSLVVSGAMLSNIFG